MSYLRRVPLVVAALATLTFTATAQASGPAGVWGRIDAVTFDPNAKDPTVRIDGVFIVANQKPDFPDYPGYSVPQYGYMFYDCPVVKDVPMCLMQWKELSDVAGKEDNCRGWGDNSNPNNGNVRAAKAPEDSPDAYPVALGVIPGFSPCEAIKTWQADNPPPEDPPDTSSSSGEPGSTGEANTTSGEPGTTGGPQTTGRPQTTGDDAGVTGEPPPDSTGANGEVDGMMTGLVESTGSVGPTEAGGGSTTNATTAPGTTTTEGQTDDKGGCACNSATNTPAGHHANHHAPPALALLAGLALLRRRRST